MEINTIGKYEIIGILGRGGMGVVYRAVDKMLARQVAIKTLTEGVAEDPEMLQRFYQEAEKTARLNHPNIVTIYDVGDQNGLPYIVMEYVEGESLDTLIRTNRAVSLITKLKIIEDVCSALGYAHRRNVIHRDVKPANVIVQPNNVPKLLDFGIARLEKRELDVHLTRAGSVIGTVPYMAPERLRSEALDRRSDIFSTGVVLYQFLTGHLPFNGEELAVVQEILREKHPPLANHLAHYPSALETVIDRALAKDPDERYSTAEEMAAEVSFIARELKREQVQEMLPQVERLVSEREYTRAKQILMQLRAIDAHHARVKELTNQVEQHISRRQREDKVLQLRAHAEDAVHDRRFDHAIAFLEEALELDPESTNLSGFLQAARSEKQKREQIDGYLRQSDAARRLGDYESARVILKRAMELDNQSSKVLAAATALEKDVEQAERKVKAKKLIESARLEISGRRFDDAIELLNQADGLDPSDAELQALLDEANSGLEQERRRRIVCELQNEAALATAVDQLQRVVQLVNDALEHMPAEASLLKLKLQLDRQVREEENAHFVDQTIKACRPLPPQEALEVVRQSLRRSPGNERLMMLESTLLERLKEKSREESRAAYMLQAREALNQQLYREAIDVLQRCQAEGLASEEISELLEVARRDAAEQDRQQQIHQHFLRAQSLLMEESYGDVIEFLGPIVGESKDLGLASLLEQARSGQEALQARIDAVLEGFRTLMQADQLSDAARLIESQPPPVLQTVPIQGALAELRTAHQDEFAIFQTIGAAYATLAQQDIELGRNTLQDGLKMYSNSVVLQRIAATFEIRTARINEDSNLFQQPQKTGSEPALGD
jgi:serine/threonine-protein kinase